MIEDAYLAGFVDGEGCVLIGASPNAYGVRYAALSLSVTQIVRAPLDLLKTRYGGSIRTYRKSTGRLVFQWIVSSRQAAAALRAMLPYLVVKANEARLAIWFQSILQLRSARGRHRLSPWDLAERESFRLALGDIHRRPIADD